MKKILCLLLCSFMIMGLSQNVVQAVDNTIPEEQIIKNDSTGIPDSVIYANVLKEGDFNNGNKDGILTYDEASTVIQLSIRESKTQFSFKGISKLSNLMNIDISYSGNYEVSELSEIKNLKNLKGLRLDGCTNITSLNDIPNKGITNLSVIDTSITDINGLDNFKYLDRFSIEKSGTQNPKYTININELLKFNLQSLNITGWNVLHSEKIKEMNSLLFLDIANTKITDFSFLPQMEQLRSLNISNNNLNKIDFISTLTNMESLDVSDNNISDISPLKNLIKLYNFIGNNNNITDLKDYPAVSTQSSISIGLSNNKIQDITPLDGIEIDALGLNGNELSNVDILSNDCFKKLWILDLGSNNLTNLPNLHHLKKLDTGTYYSRIGSTNFSKNKLSEEELISKLPIHVANNKSFINSNKYQEDPILPIPPIDVETIVSDKIPNNLSNIIKDKNNSSVVVKLPNSDTVDSNIFKASQESGKDITFNILDDKGNSKYSWNFEGRNITNPNMNIDLGIKFETDKQKEIQALTNQSNIFYASFSHHGELPGTAKITINVSNMYKDGEYIYLYYYNEEKGIIEQKGSGIEVLNGYATFDIDHCSTYFFTKEIIQENSKDTTKDNLTNNNGNTPQTSDNTNLTLLILSGGIALLGISLLSKRKKYN